MEVQEVKAIVVDKTNYPERVRLIAKPNLNDRVGGVIRTSFPQPILQSISIMDRKCENGNTPTNI